VFIFSVMNVRRQLNSQSCRVLQL